MKKRIGKSTWIFAAVATAALVVVATSAAGDPKRAPSECGDVVVQFQPEGSGGAMDISARNVACDKARSVAEDCVRGTVSEGWTVVTWTKTVMTKGEKEIKYTPVGGGGCGQYPNACKDFSYAGVGFFNLTVLGIGCNKGKQKAKKWYDSDDEDCVFGNSCEIGKYTCKGDPGDATVSCKRENGFRFEWQMGE